MFWGILIQKNVKCSLSNEVQVRVYKLQAVK